MSLLTELSDDRKYVLSVQQTDQPSDQQLDAAATAILRKVIAPTFRKMHYDGNFRTEKVLRIQVDFREEKSYTITPVPSWNFSHRGVEYSKKCNYLYMENFPKEDLWYHVADMALSEEWEMDSSWEQITNHVIIFILNLKD